MHLKELADLQEYIHNIPNKRGGDFALSDLAMLRKC